MYDKMDKTFRTDLFTFYWKLDCIMYKEQIREFDTRNSSFDTNCLYWVYEQFNLTEKLFYLII